MKMPKVKGSTATQALTGIWALLLTTLIVVTLYVARDLLIPLALAILLTFLLAPIVTRLEKWLGRIVAVLLVGATIVTATGTASWVLTRQLVDLAAKLPDYKENIQSKLRLFQVSPNGKFTKFSETVKELKQEIVATTATVLPPEPAQDEIADKKNAPVKKVEPPVPVEVIQTFSSNPVDLVQGILAPLMGPIGQAALVMLLVVFMLLQREDLRGRLVHIIGQGRISVTKRAMDDAADRVSRYLLMQLIGNVTYGIVAAIGLHFIGVPNAILWGACAAVLRFIPYVGPWIAASIPITLALAVSPGWHMPVLTLGLFVVLELLSNNVMEPWLYSSSTGVSPVALIFTAVFWTWLWGPIGLVLATPMTVCLVVLGRHIPRLSFLSVILGDEEALTPLQDLYYRLLTVGEQGEMELVDNYLKTNSLAALYDSVLIPLITALEIDHRLELVDDRQHALVEQGLRDIIDDLGAYPPARSGIGKKQDPVAEDIPQPICRFYCLPARANRDQLAGEMLVQLLQHQGYEAQSSPAGLEIAELIEQVEKSGADVVCVSVVAPSTVLHARHRCLKLRKLLPHQRIVVGLWGATENFTEASRRVRESGADEVVATLAGAVEEAGRFSLKVSQASHNPVLHGSTGRK